MSANSFSIKPELPEPFPNVPRVWTCPLTGLVVPKVPVENLQWRAKLLEAAENDTGFQAELYTACAKSILFWLNAFAFTLRIQEVDEHGQAIQAQHHHLPWVTWPIQDQHVLDLQSSIREGRDLLTDKTRDMGASWNHVGAIHHEWLFVPDSLFLEMSRVETDVDGADNPRCLFAKHDYINRWLPEWMIPAGVLPGGKHRTRMHIVNPSNGSRIDGESSNKAAGSGDRRKAVMLDEFAKMDNANAIKSSIRDVSPCLLPNSTPWGPGTAYTQWRKSGQIKVFTLPWWEHPEKGLNRYVAQDEETGRWRIRSPWYDAETLKRSPKELAQNVDMDHVGSGDTFFESNVIDQHMRLFAREPKHTATLDFKTNTATEHIVEALSKKDRSRVQRSPQGKWKIWTNLIDGRPDQTKNYCFGIDISKGQGASNSVISVGCIETREKIMEFACAQTPPYELARLVCAAALWVGGAKGLPFVAWEANGPGWDFGRQLVRIYQYPNYFVDKSVGTITEKRGKRYGWHSSREKKEILLGAYRRALAHGAYINHSKEALEETTTYIYYETGGLGPAALMEESQDARRTHGDRVIADACLMLGFENVPMGGRKQKPSRRDMRTAGGRLEARRRARRERKENKRFDFRMNRGAGDYAS